DHINQILASTDSARFAVGYFFVSGLEGIAGKLAAVKELRLLIGNTTNRETLEQLAEGYRRLELVAEAAEEQNYPKRTERKQLTEDTAENLRSAIGLTDQTDETESLVKILARLIEEKRIKVKVYTKGRLHAKAYIFTYGQVFDGSGKPLDRHEEGIAIVGSSNLTLAGITHNTELNVVVHGNDNHTELVHWFDELWDEAQDFDEILMQELQQSWALAQVRPYDIYMKTLYSLVKDRLEDEEEKDFLWDDEIVKKLAIFQYVSVLQAIKIIKRYGGAFIADVVGLGKSYIGAAIIKHFERTEHARPLIICPAALVDMWERYNEVYQLNARVLSMGYLSEEPQSAQYLDVQNGLYKDRDFVLVDESHNFRHSDTQRYKVMQGFLATGRLCCFLTATPRNKSAWDVYHQIKLFHQDDRTDIPIDPPNLKEYFKLIEHGEKKLPEMLSNILIRRTRNQILRFYGYDSQTHHRIDSSKFREYLDGRKRAYVIVGGRHQFFPKRELETIEYSIEDTYQGLYQTLRGYLGKKRNNQWENPVENELIYARYGLWHYVKKEKQRIEPYASLHRAGINLRGLMRVLLFKRFESSVYAFQQSIRNLIRVHTLFLKALTHGVIPAGVEAQKMMYDANLDEDPDLIDALRAVSGTYRVEDIDLKRLKEHIDHDIQLYQKLLKLVDPITPDKDTKLQTLLTRLAEPPLHDGKRLIFTQYADTARYLYENLNPGNKQDDIDVIFSGDKSKLRLVGRFAPKANPEYQFHSGESELMTVIATDVLAEGLNLQDCAQIINYDLHWNPVRLIQRFGRIDRIGSDYDLIYGFNFLPEIGIERNLGLHEKLRNRIQEIHDTIGEDSAILDKSEQLNEEAMYAIYEKKGGQLSLFEDLDDELVDLNEAEEILRQLRKDNPAEFQRIASLRDGIRTAMPSPNERIYVYCQAGRYHQLFLVDKQGEII
ncbi:MAG: phospholipase D-like domain-containing protein, partial [bacterium]|nr:phospholipase D-like domain-containing protein [bacterium]